MSERTTRFNREDPEFERLAEDYRNALAMAEQGMVDGKEADALLESTRRAMDEYMVRQGIPKSTRGPYETRADERVRKFSAEVKP